MEVNASFLLFLPFQYKIRREIMTNKQQELKEAEAKRKEESRIKQATEKAQNEIMGTYKRTVIDSYLKTYADNYGGTFDKNSLINSLSFSYKIEKYRDNYIPIFFYLATGKIFQSRRIKKRFQKQLKIKLMQLFQKAKKITLS